MGYDNPLQNEYEGFRQRAARIEGNWCDDCHGYTHMPYCPSYRAADEISDAATKGERQRKQLEHEASEKFDYGTRYRARQELAVLNRSQDQQHAAQLRFLGNRAEELSSLLAGMTTERDGLREVVSGLRANLQSRKFCSSCDHDYCQMGNELLTVITKDPATTTNQPEQAG